MKLLVVGNGGREHALVWKLKQSPRVTKIFCAPGNAGIADIATCVDIPADDIARLVAFAKKEKIPLTIVGPEQPLALGIVDTFKRSGLRIFGPTKEAAILEVSKAFTKNFCQRYGIPTAEGNIFTNYDAALKYIADRPLPMVVKADGLAQGKGVVVCQTRAEAREAVQRIMIEKVFGNAGSAVVIEECLLGEEVSFLAIADGNHVLPLASSQDHKRLRDGDQGPNTGGMGAYSPAPLVTNGLYEKIIEQIILPTVRGMVTEGRAFVGVLYAGLMICDGEPKLLEFNVRFGDPETQPLLLRLKTDLVDIVSATVAGTLDQIQLEWDPRPALCTVMAAAGYPGAVEKGKVMTGVAAAEALPDVHVFHAGTSRHGEQLITNGGRVLGVTALGTDLAAARTRVYEAVAKIAWEGCQYRTDIGHRALKGHHG